MVVACGGLQRYTACLRESVYSLPGQVLRVAIHLVGRAFERLTVFGTPRLIGALRKAPWSAPPLHVELREGNLMRLRTNELAAHPALRGFAFPSECRF